MNQFIQGVLQAIIAPYNPFWAYDAIENREKIHWKFVIAFFFIVGTGTLIFHLLNTLEYRTSNLTIINRFGFFAGLTIRILIVAFTLSVVISKSIGSIFSFKLSFPIVTLATSTLLYPFLFYWINPRSYIYADHLCLVWFAFIISIGVWKKTKLTFLKSFALTSISIILYWLITVTFLPYGMRI